MTIIYENFVVGAHFTGKIHYLEQGLYTLDAIQKEINRITQADVQNSNVISLSANTATSHVLLYLTLPPNFPYSEMRIIADDDTGVLKMLGLTQDILPFGNDFNVARGQINSTKEQKRN